MLTAVSHAPFGVAMVSMTVLLVASDDVHFRRAVVGRSDGHVDAVGAGIDAIPSGISGDWNVGDQSLRGEWKLQAHESATSTNPRRDSILTFLVSVKWPGGGGATCEAEWTERVAQVRSSSGALRNFFWKSKGSLTAKEGRDRLES